MIDQVVARVPACIGLAIGATQRNVRVQRFYGDTGKHGLPKADTEFEIGSITKTLTATLLAFEDQQGTMHIGDPLARYAPPGFRVPNFNGQPIQLAHLAEHTSGLPRLVPNPPSPMEPEQLWRFTGNYQLPRAPGEQFLYSNLGFALLARAMVRRSNATEDQLYSRIISGPLGLHDTSIEMTGAQRARLAQGFLRNGQPAPEFGPGFPAMAGAGAVRSTLKDMVRYLDFELGRVDIRCARCCRSCMSRGTPPARTAASASAGRCAMVRTARSSSRTAPCRAMHPTWRLPRRTGPAWWSCQTRQGAPFHRSPARSWAD